MSRLFAGKKKLSFRQAFGSNPMYFVKSPLPTVELFAQAWLLSKVTRSADTMPYGTLMLQGFTDSAKHKIFVGYSPTRQEYVVHDPMPRNPGAAWHTGMARSAERYATESREPLEKAMFKGIEVAHRDSATAARRLQMNTPKLRTILPRHRHNPLAVFGVGNPPKKITVGIAGVVYSRCLEIRAEKTKFKPGLYRHPFSRKAAVQILALDTGDLLVHSTRGLNLWEPI